MLPYALRDFCVSRTICFCNLHVHPCLLLEVLFARAPDWEPWPIASASRPRNNNKFNCLNSYTKPGIRLLAAITASMKHYTHTILPRLFAGRYPQQIIRAFTTAGGRKPTRTTCRISAGQDRYLISLYRAVPASPLPSTCPLRKICCAA